jgi:L-ascorbate metabolism protein UlaG (beta-lactamase superfamily)
MSHAARHTATIALALAVVTIPGAAAELASDTITTNNGPLVIHPIEHATFVMEWNGLTIAVDPVGDAERFTAFDPPDLILVTHIHSDHLSPETLTALTTAGTSLVMPESVDHELGDAVPGKRIILANGDRVELNGIAIEAVPAYNTTDGRLQFHPKGRDNGYVLTMGGRRVYISGDTEDIPEMRALKSIDAAFVCMNLPYTMDVEHAASAVLDFAPTVVYPTHYRGKDGMSDLERFRTLVAADPSIAVHMLDWY